MTLLSTDAAVSAVSAYQNPKLVAASFVLVNHLISKEQLLELRAGYFF